MVICLERGAYLHMVQLIPLPLTVSCSSKIQICFTFLVPADLGSPGQRAVKRVCVCVCACVCGMQRIKRHLSVTKMTNRVSYISQFPAFVIVLVLEIIKYGFGH